MFLNVVFIMIFSCQDLMIRSLADRIHDCPQMSLLYPSIPKDQGGGSTFYSQYQAKLHYPYMHHFRQYLYLYQCFEAKLPSYHIF
jgi:hypothetical protein